MLKLFAILLLCVQSVTAQVVTIGGGTGNIVTISNSGSINVAKFTSPVPSGFYPTNGVANVAAFYSYLDLPIGSTNSWTNEMPTHDVLTNIQNGVSAPTNTALGVYFYATAFTNLTPFSTDNGFSLWVDIAQVNLVTKAQIYGSATNNTTNLLFSSTDAGGSYGLGNAPLNFYLAGNNPLAGFPFGCTVTAGANVTNGPLWNDIAYSQGLIYLNGVSTGTSIPTPSLPTVNFQEVGNNSAAGNAAGLNGYIKYLLICTNHAFSSIEISNLHVWSVTNQIYNYNLGANRIAWFKFADTSNSTTVADSSPSGLTGTLYNSILGNIGGSGRTIPIWTNGINSVVNQALNFNGSNTVYIPCAGLLTNNFISGSLWVKYTNAGGAADGQAFMSMYGTIPTTTISDNTFTVFGDGANSKNGNIRVGILDGAGNFEESGTAVLMDGLWHNLAWSLDGTNVWNVWIDGVRHLGTQSGFGQNPIKGPLTTTWYTGVTNIALSFWTGTFQSTGTNQPCTMTDIQLFNRLLTDQDATVLYNGPAVDAIIGTYSY